MCCHKRATTARLPAGGDFDKTLGGSPMSGHSKWNNIKRKKEKTDGARAKVFTKIGREISVAVRDGGPNPASNSKLADLIAKAKRMSVPNDNIQRIIKKAEGGDKTEFEAITYELRPRRRCCHGRDPDRQPQPYRCRPAPLLRQERRQPGAMAVLASCSARRVSLTSLWRIRMPTRHDGRSGCRCRGL